MLDYFDAFLIGLTATPDNRTFGFFNENVVAEYTHEKSVADGVNVGYDVYEIETEITQKGARAQSQGMGGPPRPANPQEALGRNRRRHRLHRQGAGPLRRQPQPDPPGDPGHENTPWKRRSFPARKEIPKTLIFAKTDSHADDIIHIVREVYGQGNAFCKKVTYRAEEDPDSILASFRNDYNPRIAVTVDMIATGTDVKPLEVLLFMRDVRSKGYFEQMKGRGVRSLDWRQLASASATVPTAPRPALC